MYSLSLQCTFILSTSNIKTAGNTLRLHNIIMNLTLHIRVDFVSTGMIELCNVTCDSAVTEELII